MPANEIDPFEGSVWIIIMMGGKDILAKVEDCQSEDELKEELLSKNGAQIKVIRKYVLSVIQFPIPDVVNGKHTGNWNSGSIAGIARHETSLEFAHPFPTYIFVQALSFLSDLHPNDVHRLRMSVRNADQSAEMEKRAAESNIILPKSQSL